MLNEEALVRHLAATQLLLMIMNIKQRAVVRSASIGFDWLLLGSDGFCRFRLVSASFYSLPLASTSSGWPAI